MGKSIDKHFSHSASFGNRETKLDEKLLDQVIANHLFREGQPDLGQTFCKEAKVSVSEDLKRAFLDMHIIVTEVKSHHRDGLIFFSPAKDQNHCSAAIFSGNVYSHSIFFFFIASET